MSKPETSSTGSGPYSNNDNALYQMSRISVESLCPSKGLVEPMVQDVMPVKCSSANVPFFLLGALCTYAQVHLDNKPSTELLCHSSFRRNAKNKSLLASVQQLKGSRDEGKHRRVVLLSKQTRLTWQAARRYEQFIQKHIKYALPPTLKPSQAKTYSIINRF